MEKIDRRDLIKKAAAAAGAAALAGACASPSKDKGTFSGETAAKDDSVLDTGKMEFRTNNGNGDKVSLLGYGCMRFTVKEDKDGKRVVDQENANTLIDYALAHGVNYYDTSPAYLMGQSEDVTGIALERHPRDSYYIATKLSNFQDHSRKASLEMYNHSFEALRTDYIDYYLLHSLGRGGLELFDDRFINKWYGVTTEGDHIVKISMNGNNMRGELPDSLFLLPELTSIDMGNAYITGDLTTLLPDGYQNEKITRIQLFGNQLEGDAYPFVSKFPNLTYLSLAYNRLTAMSQPYTNTACTSFWIVEQFFDYKTYEPVVTEDYPAQQVTLGIPFEVEWNTAQLYNHSNQNYSRGTTYLNRMYCYNGSIRYCDYDNAYAYFQKNGEGLYEPYTGNGKVFNLPKGVPVTLFPTDSYYYGYERDAATKTFVFDWIDGDVNADQSVDVTDLQKVIYYALNDTKPTGFYNYTSADGNSDKAIDVRDAVINVNRILDFDEANTASGVRAYIKEYNVARNNVAVEEGTVRMYNADEVAALQLTIANALADDLTLSPDMAGFRMTKKQVGQNVRVVIYNMMGMTLPGGLHDILRGLDSEAFILHAVLSDEETNHLEVGIKDMVTGIGSTDNGQRTMDNEEVYDLSGRKVTTPQKNGVYIVNGKKSIIK